MKTKQFRILVRQRTGLDDLIAPMAVRLVLLTLLQFSSSIPSYTKYDQARVCCSSGVSAVSLCDTSS